MKWYVFYTTGCTPRIKSFKTKTSAKTFISTFIRENTHNTDDNWVDLLIKGDKIELYQFPEDLIDV